MIKRILPKLSKFSGAALALLAVLPVASTTAATYALPPPGDDLIGYEQNTSARYEDTLLDIARRYDLGYTDITGANPGVDTWIPGDGTPIVLPMSHLLPEVPREGIVINIAEMRLYYYPKQLVDGKAVVITHPISIGREDWATPLGVTTVVKKDKDPVWYPPETIRAEHAANGDPLPKAVPAGPNNPLGQFALRLGLSGYLIHGTDKPFGIGMQVTHGCMRLYPEDIESLFGQVPVGTPVRLINQPIKAGWHEGLLYVEVHPPFEGQPALDPTLLTQRLVAATRDHPEYRIDWSNAEPLVMEPRGAPLTVPLLAGVEPIAAPTPAVYSPPVATPVPGRKHSERQDSQIPYDSEMPF